MKAWEGDSEVVWASRNPATRPSLMAVRGMRDPSRDAQGRAVFPWSTYAGFFLGAVTFTALALCAVVALALAWGVK